MARASAAAAESLASVVGLVSVIVESWWGAPFWDGASF
jgi:hypothetical protein